RNSLLKRQIKRCLGSSHHIPADCTPFVEAVNEAYHEFDADRSMLERSLELSSQELLQANSDMRAVLQAFPDLFFWVDENDAITDYRAGDSSDLYPAPGELVGKKIHAIPVPAVREKFKQAVGRVRETRRPASIEYSLAAAAGEVFYEARLLPLPGNKIIVIVRNITDRRLTEKALEYRLELEMLIATLSTRFINVSSDEMDGAVSDALWVIGKFAEVDRSYIFQFSADGIHMDNSHEWCPESVKPAIARLQHLRRSDYAWFLKQIEDLRVVHVPRVADLPPEADVFKKELQGQGIQSLVCVPMALGGVVIGFIGFDSVHRAKAWEEDIIALLRIVGDIFANAIERKRAEVALRKSQDMLRQSQKMEAVGRLAGGIAHDFNNLMTAVLGFSRMIVERTNDEQIRADAEEVVSAGERATKLTAQLLAFSRKQLREMKRIDLNRIVSEMERLLQRTLGEDINLITVLADDLGAVEANAGNMEQIVMNLALNGRDAMREGGDLTIATEKVLVGDRDERLLLGLKPGPYVVLSVKDEGCGMTAEVREHAFEPFFTTKPEGRGTGLGLPTVYAIVQQCGGAVDLVVRPGGGTEVRVYLPLIDAPADAPAESLADELTGGTETVLLAEDEDAVRRLAARFLSRLGYKVLEARNGFDALDLCKHHHGPIHLVVTDVVMPRMGGLALTEELSALRRDAKILYVTGFSETTAFNHTKGALVRQVLFKPYSQEALAKRVRQILDGADLEAKES
ncbi:MAG: hypothetical protein BWK77_01545, partial [Verrucomicrobia bacterium A1]